MNHFDDEQNKEQLTPLQERLRREEIEAQQKKAKEKKGASKAGYFISGLSGIIVGALLMWLLLPSIIGPSTNSSSETNGTTLNDQQIQQSITEVSSDITKAVENVSPAVVGITNIQEVSNFWNETSQQQAGSGSGVIYKIDKDKAYIITNHHVVDRASQLEVTLADGTKEPAQFVGSDIWTDLAVLAINSKNVKTVATFGDSDVLKQGETVIAIGNPLGLEFYGSVTKGIVSGKDRSVPVDLNNDGKEDWQTEVLQTDAAINPGNSGGALINVAGELVGINSMKIAESRVEGLGFSIPINSAIPIIEELEAHGEVKRPTMGVSLMNLTDVPAFYQKQTLRMPEEITTGVVVSEIMRGSAAEKAGLEQYDVIVEMDGKKIENAIDLRKHLYNEKKVGDTLTLKVYRQGEIVDLQLTLNANATL